MDTTFVTLTKLIKESSNVIIMAHKNIDIDAFAACFCLYEIVTSFGRPCYLCYKKENIVDPVTKAYDLLEQKKLLPTILKKSIESYEINEQTLLVVLDTHKGEMVENPHLLEKIDKIAVIDHHIKSAEYIKDTKLSYINANLSSTSEIMTNYSRYLTRPMSPLLATFLLTGIEVDTNGFTNKTTEKTYETAAYLTKMGADPLTKQELLKQDKDTFLKRQEEIKKSTMINDNMALCVLEEDTYDKVDLAKISEELIQFEKVDAAFTIGRLSTKLIGISARSTGKIDVEAIVHQLGGGGHVTEAACQLETSLNEAKEKLVSLLSGSFDQKEGGIS